MKTNMKTSIKMKLMLLLTLITLFSGCEKPADSQDVNQDKIYGEYELFYDKNQDKTFASAWFKFNSSTGTPLQLSAPSEVKFNSDAIPYDPLFGYYRKEYAGQITTGTFNFKDTDGKVYSNTVNLAKAITNPSIDTIRRMGAYTYTFTGDSLIANELIGLTIGNTTNPANFQVFLQNTLNSKSIVLPLTQLNQLPVGMSYCQLDRQIEKAATSTTDAGGKIRGKYRGLNKNTYVK
jgi:major membrane immunogen (membrane-anchored lipoprotein)